MPSDPPSAEVSRPRPGAGWRALRSQEQEGWTEVQEQVMEHLYEAHARPLQVLAIQRGHEPEEAEALVQAFFAIAVSRGLLQDGKARLRPSMREAFTNWLAHEQRQENLGSDSSSLAADEAYDREWAGAVLGRAMRQVRRVYELGGRMPVFEVLRGVLPGGGGVPSYTTIAMDFGMTEQSVRQAAEDLRHSCNEFLRAEVAQTVSGPEWVEEELHYLLELLHTNEKAQ